MQSIHGRISNFNQLNISLCGNTRFLQLNKQALSLSYALILLVCPWKRVHCRFLSQIPLAMPHLCKGNITYVAYILPALYDISCLVFGKERTLHLVPYHFHHSTTVSCYITCLRSPLSAEMARLTAGDQAVASHGISRKRPLSGHRGQRIAQCLPTSSLRVASRSGASGRSSSVPRRTGPLVSLLTTAA